LACSKIIEANPDGVKFYGLLIHYVKALSWHGQSLIGSNNKVASARMGDEIWDSSGSYHKLSVIDWIK
jgi:hypothetical protein